VANIKLFFPEKKSFSLSALPILRAKSREK